MLGYLKDKTDYFKGNLIEFNLKQAVAFSGGTQKHYEYFKAILNYSIYNLDTKRPLHDIKAGQFSLYSFPIKIRTILSLIFYQYEQNLIKEYNNFNLKLNNILLPSVQLQFSSIITEERISSNLLNLVDDIALNRNDISVLFNYLNITNINSKLNESLLLNLELLFSAFNLSINNIENYITLIKNNDRYKILTLSAEALNYKPQSINYLTEAATKWHQTSNI